MVLQHIRSVQHVYTIYMCDVHFKLRSMIFHDITFVHVVGLEIYKRKHTEYVIRKQIIGDINLEHFKPQKSLCSSFKFSS